MKVNRKLKKFAKDRGYRLVVFMMETPKGSTIEYEGCVTVKDSEEIAEMMQRTIELTRAGCANGATITRKDVE